PGSAGGRRRSDWGHARGRMARGGAALCPGVERVSDRALGFVGVTPWQFFYGWFGRGGAADQRGDRGERGSRGDKEGLAVHAVEGEVGGGLGHGDLADQLSFGREDVHAVAGAGPDVALLVTADAVGGALVDDAKLIAARECAVVFDVERADVVGLAAVGD